MSNNSSDYGSRRLSEAMGMSKDMSALSQVLTTDTATVAAIAVPAIPSGTPSIYTAYQIFVQRITLSVTTDAAQSLTFQDTNGTPVVFAKSKVSPGLGLLVVCDFGPKGFGLTKGKGINYVISGAGLGCLVNIEAFAKLVK